MDRTTWDMCLLGGKKEDNQLAYIVFLPRSDAGFFFFHHLLLYVPLDRAVYFQKGEPSGENSETVEPIRCLSAVLSHSYFFFSLKIFCLTIYKDGFDT